MAQVIRGDANTDADQKSWLKVAAAVKRDAASADMYRHAPAPGASVERLRELAGIIGLAGSVPSLRFLDDDGDAAYGRVDDLDLWSDLIHQSQR